MNWKAYSTWAMVALFSFFVVGCSSNPKPKAKITKQQLYAENSKLGAVYKNRTSMPSYMHFARVKAVENKQSIVNRRDFLSQLDLVRLYSSQITGSYASVYNKIQRWVNAGANVNTLSKYGININLMRGQDGYQNVNFTGYYAPVLQARRSPQGQFQHPLYRMPSSNKRFSRAQIYAGALKGRGLEIAYTNSMVDNFFLGVQGSGFIDFGEGRLSHVAYAGQNGYKYASIGRLLVEDGEIPKDKMSAQAIKDWAKRNPYRTQQLLERNPSYVFFRFDNTHDVKGSAGVPLVALASVASDKSIVPSGSVLLVEMPLIDSKGNWTRKYEMRLMIALDVGGAVKGHHFDIYQGIEGKNRQASQTAGLLKHFGRVWVLN